MSGTQRRQAHREILTSIFHILIWQLTNIHAYSQIQSVFPSSADGTGFKALADYVHSLGLKFGIHIMRGIPRIAAHTHMAVKKTDWTANQIADPSSICGWNPDMYGVRNCEAGQAYYDFFA